MDLPVTFVEGAVVALGASFVASIFAAIRLLNSIHSDVKGMKNELAKNTRAMDSVFTALRYMLTATRYQNVALKQAGANGCTEQSDEFIDKAEAALNRRAEGRSESKE